MNKPLAAILRPEKLDEVIGQTHLFGKNSMIKRMVESKKLFSIIFYGPPGIGKTSISFALVNDLKVSFEVFNPVMDKKEKLLSIISKAVQSPEGYVIILEEAHRLNKDKQDILLSNLENGTITIFATTTENPYFVINPAIRSRCQILQLLPLTTQEVYLGLRDKVECAKLKIKIKDEILKIIADQTNGDLRSALNIIDILNKLYTTEEINEEVLRSIMQQSYVLSADYGDEFYDIKSAFHKSLRGSDADAAIYYLARLIHSGDLISTTRRMIACAYEDIGLANPTLCSRIVNGVQAAKEVGFPEAKQILAELVIEMCLSPKSNSAYLAIARALKDIELGKAYKIPNHLRDNSYKSSSSLGITGYLYPHDFPNSYVKQQYLPKELANVKYYIPNDKTPIEFKMNEYMKKIKNDI